MAALIRYPPTRDAPSRSSIRRCAICCAYTVFLGCVLANATFVAGDDEARSYLRWAIIPAADVEASGIPDLLTARLSKDAGIELLEREDLELATRELELSAYTTSAASAKRLQLGRLLKADALLLLSIETREQKKVLQLVIADCNYGARLHVDRFPYNPDTTESLVDKCADSIAVTRSRFRSGIKHLICVSNFLSKSLTHDYDNWQSGFASLLASSLLSHQGVAVVEIEEARAIGRELELAAEELKRRIVPLFVDGEYEVLVAKPDDEPAIRLVMRVSDGKQILSRGERSGLTQSEAAALLTDQLPRGILRQTEQDSANPVSRGRQREFLLERAAAFSQVGDWENAAALREAAILLRDDFEQRIELIGDYRRLRYQRHRALAQQRSAVNRRDAIGSLPSSSELRAELLERFRLIALHTEDIIRRRYVNPYEATQLFRSSTVDMSTCIHDVGASKECRQVADTFFWRIIPLFPKLDYELASGTMRKAVARSCIESIARFPQRPAISRASQYRAWVQMASEYITWNSPMFEDPQARKVSSWDGRKILDELYRLLTEVTDQSSLNPTMATLTLGSDISGGSLNQKVKRGIFTQAEVSDFYQRLRKTGNPFNTYYARCGDLSLQVYFDTTAEISSETHNEADQLLDFVTDRAEDPGDLQSYRIAIFSLHRDIETKIAKANGAKRHSLPTNPVPPDEPSRRVAFLPVDGIKSPWLSHQRCTDSLDVMWSLVQVCVMREKGVVEQVYRPQDPLDQIVDVQWDGENLWVACTRTGIRIVSPQGNVRGQVNADQGLPPFTVVQILYPMLLRAQKNIWLHPLGVNRCLVIGRYGKNARVWVAEVSLAKGETVIGKYDVKVIHTATKLDVAEDNPELTFTPVWMLEYTGPETPSRVLLIGRMEDRPEHRDGRRPLAIALDTLEISLFPARIRSPLYDRDPRYCVDGSILQANLDRVVLHERNAENGTWNARPLVTIGQPTVEPLNPMLILQDQTVLSPGVKWRRIHPYTWKVEPLTTAPLPRRHRYEYFGKSAHYGIVAWNYGDYLHKVVVEADSTPEDPSLLYPFVPSEARQRHHNAVTTIKKLGGSVDFRWKDYTFGMSRQPAPEWRTTVYLPKSWRGNSSELNLLKELYHLRALYLVQARLTDEDMKVIGQLGDVEELWLVETQVTDTGIRHFQNLRRLMLLCIEGTGGGSEFSDACLTHLSQLPRLEYLSLYGQGFTDQGLTHLATLRSLRKLVIADTAISNEGLLGVRQKIPRLSWSKK